MSTDLVVPLDLDIDCDTLDDAHNLGTHLAQEFEEQAPELRQAHALPPETQLRHLNRSIHTTFTRIIPRKESQTIRPSADVPNLDSRDARIEEQLQRSRFAIEQLAKRNKIPVEAATALMRTMLKGEKRKDPQ